MNEPVVSIYVNPSDPTETFPQDIYGDMSVFKGFRSEVQWIFYLYFRQHFKKITLRGDYPKEGIFIIHKGNADRFIWNPDLFVVSPQWDYPRDDRAQVHFVSNQYKTTRAALGLLDRWSFAGLQYCLPPLFMHPTIIPRNENRGDTFEHVVFMGDPKNLDPAFRTGQFEHSVAELGMKFLIIDDMHKHHDFSEVDVVMAVRQIGKVITNKPAVKLYNAWRGHVPALLGCETGFREVRQSPHDYIEVDSVDDVINALTRLKEDPDLRRTMIANAKKRGESYTPEVQKERWFAFFDNTIIPAYEAWQRRSGISKRWFLFIRWLRHQIRGMSSLILHRIMGLRETHYH